MAEDEAQATLEAPPQDDGAAPPAAAAAGAPAEQEDAEAGGDEAAADGPSWREAQLSCGACGASLGGKLGKVATLADMLEADYSLACVPSCFRSSPLRG